MACHVRYTPRTPLTSGRNINLLIKVVTKYNGDERHWINGVVVHAGEAPLPRFSNQWLYEDLHYHSQMTDNEGESGYSYRNVVRTLGALGMDFVFATDHVSDSSQVDGDIVVYRCGSKLGSACIYDSDSMGVANSCTEGGQARQCLIVNGTEARDLNHPRFTAAKQILYGQDGANSAVGRDLETNGFARYRSAGLVPQVYMGEEIDEMPEISQGEYDSGFLTFGDNLKYPWSHVSSYLKKPRYSLCPNDGMGEPGYCLGKPTVQAVCQNLFSLIRTGPTRYFTKDYQGHDSFFAQFKDLEMRREPSRQHLVYYPSSGAADDAGFVSGKTGRFGGAGRTLDEVVREIETKGVTFLAHPVSEAKPGSKEAPDLVPYSDLVLERAWSSRAVLGLQFWNENNRFKSQTDEGPLPPAYDTGGKWRNLAPLIHGGGFGVNFNLTDANAGTILGDNYYGLRNEVSAALPDINRVRLTRSRVWENQLPDGGKSYTAPRPFLYPYKPLSFGNLTEEDPKLTECLANHSRATASKLFAVRSARANFSALRFSEGSSPVATCLRASSRLSRASFNPTSG